MNKKSLISLVLFLALVALATGISLAYFTPIIIGNEMAGTYESEAAHLELTYNGESFISLENIKPGTTQSISFSVLNTGNVGISSYQVNLSKLVNTFIKNEVLYSITCSSSDASTCYELSQRPVPLESGLILNQTTINPGVKHTYTLTVLFEEKNIEQNYNQEKTLVFTVTIGEVLNEGGTLKAINHSDYNYFYNHSRQGIVSLTFLTGSTIPSEANFIADISEEEDGSVHIFSTSSARGQDVFIQGTGTIFANSDSSYLFYNLPKLTKINNLHLLNTSKTTNMESMFESTPLVELDLLGFNTSNVTNMANMFGSGKYTSLNLTSFDTSNVLNMSFMFYYNEDLTSVNLTSFDTSKVTDMSVMFCFTGLIYLDLSSFNTLNVINMSEMFSSSEQLQNVDLSSFNTPKVTNMASMFYCCVSLRSLDLSSFDTNNVTTMQWMFELCGVTKLDLSSFETPNLVNMGAMFWDCPNLTSVDVSSFDTSKVTNMGDLFNYCVNLESVDVSNFDTSSVTYFGAMFRGCKKIKKLDLSSFNMTSALYIQRMFADCPMLTEINFSTASFTTVINHDSMFLNAVMGINILVKDIDAKTYIEARLADAGKTGNVTVYVP